MCRTLLFVHISNYYKPTDEYLANEYVKAIPYLTISEAVELKGKLDDVVKERNEKIGELERENVALRRELDGIKEQLKLLTEMLTKDTKRVGFRNPTPRVS